MPEGRTMPPEREVTYEDVVAGRATPEGKWIEPQETVEEKQIQAGRETDEDQAKRARSFLLQLKDDLYWAEAEISKDDLDRISKSELRRDARQRLADMGIEQVDMADLNRAVDLLDHPDERAQNPEQWEAAQTRLQEIGVDVERLADETPARVTVERNIEPTQPELAAPGGSTEAGGYEPMTEAEIAEARERVAPGAFQYRPEGAEPENVVKPETEPVEPAAEDVLEGEFHEIEHERVFYPRILEDLETATQQYQRTKGVTEAGELRAARVHNARIDEAVDNLDVAGIDMNDYRGRGDDARRNRTRLTVAVGTVQFAREGREVDAEDLRQAVAYLNSIGVDTDQLDIPVPVVEVPTPEPEPHPEPEPAPEAEAQATEAAGGIPVRNRNDQRVADDLATYQRGFAGQPEKLLGVIRNRLSRERGLSPEMVIYLDHLQGELQAQIEGTQTARPGDIEEMRRRFDNLASYSGDPRELGRRAQRWIDDYRGRAWVPEDLVKQAEEWAEAGKSSEKISEVEIPTPEVRQEIEVKLRMAMIQELGERANQNMNVAANFEQFISAQARARGFGKTHFPKEFQDEIKKEYFARAELAGVLDFWDDLASIMSRGTDVWKEMSEARIDRCIKLSRSTYDWLADGNKRLRYSEEKGVERVGGEEVELRRQMDRVSSVMYTRMLLGKLDMWNTRGEDRLTKINELAEELDVATDAVRLSWQLAEAEVWQARMKVSFVSHPAGRVVVPSETRDFKTRKAMGVPGGSRLWSERLRAKKNVFPDEYDTHVYDAEGRRFARVGFEAWTVKVSKEKDSEGHNKDPRFAEYRSGMAFLFSERGGIPSSLARVINNPRLMTVDAGNGLTLAVDEARYRENVERMLAGTKEGDERDTLRAILESAVGGERALISGEYLTKLEALLAQPGIINVDLPQTITMTDLSKAAGVYEAMESLGKVDATKASTKELGDLRNALTSQLFRFSGNDLERRVDSDGNDYQRMIYMNEGTRQEMSELWVIESATQERMTRARVRTGELLDQWARTYVWLMSWDNPAHRSEQTVMGMRDWVNLAREIARAYDVRRQWGEYLGYGEGNYDSNELAVDKNGKSRKGPTLVSKQAAEEYAKWFDRMYEVHRQIIAKKQRAMTKERRSKDIGEMGSYGGPFFWTKAWWK